MSREIKTPELKNINTKTKDLGTVSQDLETNLLRERELKLTNPRLYEQSSAGVWMAAGSRRVPRVSVMDLFELFGLRLPSNCIGVTCSSVLPPRLWGPRGSILLFFSVFLFPKRYEQKHFSKLIVLDKCILNVA